MPEQDTDLTRLFVRDLDDIPLPVRERWRPAPRKGSFLMSASRTFAFGATAIGVLVLALFASFALRDRTPIAASPTPSASATATSSATPTATASASASTTPTTSPLGPVRFASAVGYAIETPSPWHLSTCIELVQGVERGGDVFVPVPAYDESSSDIGAAYPSLNVIAEPNPQRLTPRQWLESGRGVGGSILGQIEDASYAGRQAARKSIPDAPGVYHYAVANGDRMFVVSPVIMRPLDASLRPSLVRMIDSFQLLSDAERAAARAALPPAPAPRTPEQVADGIAAALAAKDTSALSALAAPCMFRFGENAGGTNSSRAKYLDDLRAMFASGLTVTVEARPINRESVDVTWVASTWKDSRCSQTRRLIMMRGPNDQWRWAGTVERYGVCQ